MTAVQRVLDALARGEVTLAFATRVYRAWLAAKPGCDECDGSGEVLDAPGNVLDGRAYWTPCPVCRA